MKEDFLKGLLRSLPLHPAFYLGPAISVFSCYLSKKKISVFSIAYIICLLATGNPEGLGAELLETLVKMAPTKEEEIKLRDYCGDISKLGSAERFLKAVLDIPYAFKRVEAMLYRANFDAEVKYLRKSFQTLEVLLAES